MKLEIVGGMPGAPPSVGQTVHCSEPIVSGGVGPFQFSYAWTENDAIVFEQRFLSNSFVLLEEDAGKVFACIVSVADEGNPKGMAVQVKSNTVGPILPASLSEGVQLACVAMPTFSSSNGVKEGSVLHRLTTGHCNVEMNEDRYFWMACEDGRDQSSANNWNSRSSDKDYTIDGYDVSKGHSFKLEQRWNGTDNDGTYMSTKCNSAVLNP